VNADGAVGVRFFCLTWQMISISEELARFPVEKTQMRMPGHESIRASTNIATDQVLPQRLGVIAVTSYRILDIPRIRMTRTDASFHSAAPYTLGRHALVKCL